MSQEFEAVIGLEVHAQLLTRTKMFCGCSTRFGQPPNSQTCPVCLGLPGALPVVNQKAIEYAIRAGLALNCQVRGLSQFSRKNYFYPDLSKGYQISQFDLPLNEHGKLNIESNGNEREVSIVRIHVEEDAAKNLHGGTADATLVNFNRGGMPLIEIVGGPDLKSSDEAESYLKRLREILMFMGINDGNLEEGSFRCDANVSVMPKGSKTFGTRTELKNINSFKFVKKAIDYEIERQINVITSGGKVEQETRSWSEHQGKTIVMRKKEQAQDYRYFPDPDLPILDVTKMIAHVAATMPELPVAIRKRLIETDGLAPYDTQVLTLHPEHVRYYEQVRDALLTNMSAHAQPTDAERKILAKKAANFIISEGLRHVTTQGLESHFPCTPAGIAGLLTLVEKGTINGKIAKEVFAAMVETGKNPERIVKDKGLEQVVDEGAIRKMVEGVVSAFPSELEKYRAGKLALFSFFVGQVMKTSKGSANPAVLNEVLKSVLGPFDPTSTVTETTEKK